jgi:molybdenum cofactor synthesis domain-containing protein
VESLDRVRTTILDAVPRLPAVRAPLRDALGLVLAETVVAPEPVPPFDNSAMDGYAVRSSDVARATEADPVRLKVVGELPAGHAPTTSVRAGEAVRIMTGAPIPDGADAVVMVEQTTRDGDDGVLVAHAAELSDHVRPAGGDIAAGLTVFEPGIELTPSHLGVLASLGMQEVLVTRKARVGVLSTGDELREGPERLGPGQIRDSNRPMLVALLAEAGCEALDLGVGPDDEALVTRLIDDALGSCDALVTSGGVSVGDYDVVKAVLERFGVLQWWQVAVRPAKPLAFGVLRDRPVFGLPGNPVSSLVSFELFARPALRTMMGHTVVDRPVVEAIAAEPLRRRRDGRMHLDRAVATYDGTAYRVVRSGFQASNVLSGLANANALALIPDGEGVEEGDRLQVMLLR